MARKPALGKGLRALIPEIPPGDEQSVAAIQDVAVESVLPNPFQPREHFDAQALEELKASIAEKGLVQPITVRRFDGRYQLIAGERRLRAVRELGLPTIPAYVLEVQSDEEMLELSIIENIHREDLNPLEVARGYQRLIDECHLTQEEVAQKVGKDRSTVANFLRLLKLPRRIQESLANGELSMGHARALLALNNSEDQIRIWQQTVKHALSVRKVEELVRGALQGPRLPKVPEKELPPQVREMENRLRHALATQVHIKPRGRRGIIEIEYYSDDDLDRLIGLICRTL
ncbi:MAG: ParB/RepB/Spo0J family partition protein [candidate division KSB1 bacterium]|nr:ParB/RepB/Spo0J family partition protein [candidate division KSB1 bacterium]MDZ7412046.1 ParB/RepB/Spo0J family partition protein [candidate division KSB1 bacterium]